MKFLVISLVWCWLICWWKYRICICVFGRYRRIWIGWSVFIRCKLFIVCWIFLVVVWMFLNVEFWICLVIRFWLCLLMFLVWKNCCIWLVVKWFSLCFGCFRVVVLVLVWVFLVMLVLCSLVLLWIRMYRLIWIWLWFIFGRVLMFYVMWFW